MENQFKKTLTYPRYFHGIANVNQVQMMTQTGRFRFVEDATCQVLELPYEGDEFSMMIMLPREKINSPQFNIAFIDKLLCCYSEEVIVHLPKFTSEAKTSLVEPLMQLDAISMFTENADFNLISANKLYVSDIIHAAKIIVDEEGTEAAAVTAMIFECCTSVREPPKVFLADHPFAYAIVHKPSKQLLFLGNVNDIQ